MDTLQFEVLDGAKAHVGKVLDVHVDSLHRVWVIGNHRKDKEYTALDGWLEYMGLVWSVSLTEYTAYTYMELRNGKRLIKFKNVKLV